MYTWSDALLFKVADEILSNNASLQVLMNPFKVLWKYV